MRNRYHTFSNYHPAAVFVYIAAAIVCAMFTMQPVYVILSFAAGTAYAIYLGGARKYVLGIRPLAIMFALIAIINPLTNHRGATVLFHLGNYPITLQSLLFGLCAGGMLICVFVWCMCYQRLITNDKFMYLFGRAAPTSAMIISMILKFVPVMSVRMREIANAQAALGVAGDGGGRVSKIKNGVRVSGILISRSMEDSIETADSMRARGYGSGVRTSFSRYRMRGRDVAAIVVVATLFAVNIWCIFFYGEAVHGTRFRFFPFVSGIISDPLPYVLYLVLLLWPLLDEAVTNLKNLPLLRANGRRERDELGAESMARII